MRPRRPRPDTGPDRPGQRADGEPGAPRVVTIGVYGSTAGAFLAELTRAGAGLLLDLRRRRGVRRPQQGGAIAIRLATLPDDGPTRGFFEDAGTIPW